MKYIVYIAICFLAISTWSCTDLEEEIRDKAEQQNIGAEDLDGLLQGAYASLRQPFINGDHWFALQVLSSDEGIAPTRGGDWDDGGVWREMHNHQWTVENSRVQFSFTALLSIVFNTSNILSFSPGADKAAEARYLRALAMFQIADGWNQVPFRDGETLQNLLLAPTVVSGEEALEFIISELNSIMGDLPDGPAFKANKDAARVLLMKCYLNRGTFADRANPSFPNEDMQQVVSLGDEIINSGRYSLAENYFDNFAVENTDISTENIFTIESRRAATSGEVFQRWFSVSHYNQNPSGWNGFATLADFYDSFEEEDNRRSAEYNDLFDNTGYVLGFMEGQQVDGDGNPLTDRRGAPLSFTKEVNLVESGSDLEVRGIRVCKYEVDQENTLNTQFPGNDYVIYRYADVMLMRAEAAMRLGDNATALDIVNQIRTVRNATSLTSITLDDLLAERGRELYWEGHRRTDLIRFGKYLQPWHDKPQSGPERLLFPIPGTAIASNPNLTQNPGY